MTSNYQLENSPGRITLLILEHFQENQVKYWFPLTARGTPPLKTQIQDRLPSKNQETHERKPVRLLGEALCAAGGETERLGGKMVQKPVKNVFKSFEVCAQSKVQMETSD